MLWSTLMNWAWTPQTVCNNFLETQLSSHASTSRVVPHDVGSAAVPKVTMESWPQTDKSLRPGRRTKAQLWFLGLPVFRQAFASLAVKHRQKRFLSPFDTLRGSDWFAEAQTHISHLWKPNVSEKPSPRSAPKFSRLFGNKKFSLYWFN